MSPRFGVPGWPAVRRAALGLVVGATGVSQSSPVLQLWRRNDTRVEVGPNATDAPMAVGSLQKPFVARAWAAAHPSQAPPRVPCTPASGCWHRGGHGEVGLVKATAVSCNAYFRHLAADTPLPLLTSHLEREGFRGDLHSPEGAIGLPDGYPGLLIRPSALLEGYANLIRTPWAVGEPVRQQLLAGLREAALTGTAGAVNQRGYWAKTGTIPSTSGHPLQTCGLALVVDDTGWGVLARLEPGTGREAAAALAAPLAGQRPWSMGHDDRTARRAVRTSAYRDSKPRLPGRAEATAAEGPWVTVRMFDLLRPRRWVVRNLGAAPIPSSKGGFLGPGAAQELTAGDWAGPGLLEIEAVGMGLHRRLQGRLHCMETRRLQATLTAREYARGVIAAELPAASESRRVELGAAVLRFLARGPRHGDADVCDSTHCAWFIGRGPRVEWPHPTQAVATASPMDPALPALSDETWDAMKEQARHPGPCQWTSHCGGQPLSPQALWANGDRTVYPCPRHGGSPSHPWQRIWKAADLAKAFGVPVLDLAVEMAEGVWSLRVTGPKGTRTFRYDDAHRRIASVLGWDGLPSPADSLEQVPGGFRATGVGSGHRAGLCLGE